MISIVDYGCGNIKAFQNVFKKLNVPIQVVTQKEDLANASGIILPGVGAFDFVMRSFNNSGMRESVESKIFEEKIPVLGVCAGMQIMASSSEEGQEVGLGWIGGTVRHFDTSTIPFSTKVPHMGWNSISPTHSKIFSGIEHGARYYFVHTYYFDPENSTNSIATSNYGGEFTCAVEKENIYGVQFHPEKSHSAGIELLKNFSELVC
jgi:imidazole glycerol-phosphate synthase subunit HisH